MTVLLLAVIFAGALALLTDLVLHVSPWGWIPADNDARATFVDLIKVSLAVAGGVGAAVALVVAYRRQRHLEVDEAGKRSRYAGAAQQLGDPEAAVRLAGAYAMAHLADEWPEQRQQCVDVLCAYLRLPWVVDNPTSVESTSFTIQRVYPIGEGGQHTETRVYSGRSGEREVRRTLTRIVTDHLGPTSAVSWAELRLDLTGATLVDANFTTAHIGEGSTMERAHFVGAASFRGASFSGDPDYSEASFAGASFSGDADFSTASFFGDADFSGGSFLGDASFTKVSFSGVLFKGASFSETANFGGASFSSGPSFSNASFLDDASFIDASFSGISSFIDASFSEEALFRGASFSGLTSFVRVSFSGLADFSGTSFSGTPIIASGGAMFFGASFSGRADFSGASFSGRADFAGTEFRAESTWAGARLPSRKVFEGCAQRPTPGALDEADYGDGPDSSG